MYITDRQKHANYYTPLYTTNVLNIMSITVSNAMQVRTYVRTWEEQTSKTFTVKLGNLGLVVMKPHLFGVQ